MRFAVWQRLVARAVLVTFTTSFVGCGGSQSEQPSTTTMTTVTVTLPPPPAPPSTLPAQPPEQLSKQELRELVAPVALYPDVVLASLLPATTNPEQIHDAAQYVGQAQHVDKIPEDRGWDGSVVGLLQFPDVLRWLDGNPAWTDEMGQAMTYQQGDVLDAIQDYRRSVKDAGNLKSNQYQTVRTGDRDIRIEPAHPDVVYVPSYDPAVATQPQPPQQSPGINPWIVFGAGAAVGALGAWALYSIFDDDDDDKTVVNNYYRGGGRRRVRGYDNYYYSRGRRPRPVEWTPRQRARAARPEGWNRPRRLEHVSPSARPAKRAAALRPPRTAPGAAPAAQPGQTRREQKQENRAQRQMQQREQRQQKQQRQQSQRQQRQQPRAVRQEEQRKRQQEQRQQRQEQQRQNREQRQERQREQQQREEELRHQRQEQQRQQQEMRQERREQRQEERRGEDGKGQKKKKQQQQNQENQQNQQTQ